VSRRDTQENLTVGWTVCVYNLDLVRSLLALLAALAGHVLRTFELKICY
jgi:hypothetical protein